MCKQFQKLMYIYIMYIMYIYFYSEINIKGNLDVTPLTDNAKENMTGSSI